MFCVFGAGVQCSPRVFSVCVWLMFGMFAVCEQGVSECGLLVRGLFGLCLSHWVLDDGLCGVVGGVCVCFGDCD